MTPAHGDLRQTASPGIADKTCSLHFRNRHSPAADHHFHSSISSCSSRYPLGMCAHKPSRITQVDIGMFTPELSHTTQVNMGMSCLRQNRPSPAHSHSFGSGPRTCQADIAMCVPRPKRTSQAVIAMCGRQTEKEKFRSIDISHSAREAENLRHDHSSSADVFFCGHCHSLSSTLSRPTKTGAAEAAPIVGSGRIRGVRGLPRAGRPRGGCRSGWWTRPDVPRPAAPRAGRWSRRRGGWRRYAAYGELSIIAIM